MNTHAVKLQVEAKVPKECIFWLEADVWTVVIDFNSLRTLNVFLRKAAR